MTETDMIEVKVLRQHLRINGRGSPMPDPWHWCCDNLGRPEPNGSRWAWDGMRTYWFYRKDDALLFRLVWS